MPYIQIVHSQTGSLVFTHLLSRREERVPGATTNPREGLISLVSCVGSVSKWLYCLVLHYP